VDDVEAAVKAALTFMGNASSQCNIKRRTLVLEEYNKDLAKIQICSPQQQQLCLGHPFQRKLRLTQLKTLRQTGPRVFPRPPHNTPSEGAESRQP